MDAPIVNPSDRSAAVERTNDLWSTLYVSEPYNIEFGHQRNLHEKKRIIVESPPVLSSQEFHLIQKESPTTLRLLSFEKVFLLTSKVFRV